MSDPDQDGSRGVSQPGASAPAAPAPQSGADLFGQVLSPHPDEVEAAPQKFGVGRRPGSRNKSTEDLARLVQQIGGHPVLAMARIAGMSLQQIKEMLGCNRLEAFDRWVMVLDKLAPYVASKQPLAVAVSGKVTALNFTVPMGDGAQLVGVDGVAALFQAARDRAAGEGFDLVQIAAPVEDVPDAG